MVTQWFGWTRSLVLAVVLLFLLAAPGETAARGDVLVDDPFDGDSLDPGLWYWWYWGQDPQPEPVVSDGRLTLSAGFPAGAYVISLGPTAGYTAPTLYDLRVEQAGEHFNFSFGYNISDWASSCFWTDGSRLYAYAGAPGSYVEEDLGPWIAGDYGIDRTGSYFKVYRDGALLFSTEDLGWYLDLGMYVQDGTVSLDRVVVLTPEPGTLTLLVAGSVLCLRRRGRHQ